MAWSHYEISSMTSGRHTSWTQEYSDKAEEYLEAFINPEPIDPNEPYNPASQVFPSVAGMAVALNIGRSTLYGWELIEETGFHGILRRTVTLQESYLLNNGLNGKFNSNITKLALGKHGYKDETGLTGANNTPLIPQETELETVRRAAFAIAKALKDATDE